MNVVGDVSPSSSVKASSTVPYLPKMVDERGSRNLANEASIEDCAGYDVVKLWSALVAGALSAGRSRRSRPRFAAS